MMILSSSGFHKLILSTVVVGYMNGRVCKIIGQRCDDNGAHREWHYHGRVLNAFRFSGELVHLHCQRGTGDSVLEVVMGAKKIYM